MKARRFVFAFVLLLTLMVPLLPASAADGTEEAAAVPVLQPSTPAPLTPLQPAETPIFMVTRACCLDEWQPGNCPVGTRVFAYCTGACDVCGSFTCVSNTTSCLK